FSSRRYAVLAPVSQGYSPPKGRLPTCYSPVRHCTQGLLPFLVRLACVKRAASVDSEPGSNSHLILFVSNRFRPIAWPFHDSYVTLLTIAHEGWATTELLETSQLLLKVLTKY